MNLTIRNNCTSSFSKVPTCGLENRGIPIRKSVLYGLIVQAAQALAQVGEVSDVNRNVNIVNSPVVS